MVATALEASMGDFSWEGGGILLQNIYKPFQDLWEATHTNSEILLLYYKDLTMTITGVFTRTF